MIKYTLKFKVHTLINNLILSPDLQSFGKYYYLRNIFIRYLFAKLFEEMRIELFEEMRIEKQCNKLLEIGNNIADFLLEKNISFA